MVNVQKRLKGASAEADFWHIKYIEHVEKKAPNSDFRWGPLHGEIGLLKKMNIFVGCFYELLLKDLKQNAIN